MKFSSISLFFFSLMFCYMVIAACNTQLVQETIRIRTSYNLIFDRAMIDALDGIVEADEYGQIYLNKQEAVKRFFHSLSLNLDAYTDSSIVTKLQEAFPFILITDQTGFALFHYYEEKDENGKVIGRWGMQEKTYYENLSQVEKIELMRKTMEEVLSENLYLKSIGMNFDVTLPYKSQEEWYQTVEENGMLAFYHSKVLNAGPHSFSRFLFSGARVVKENEKVDLRQMTVVQ